MSDLRVFTYLPVKVPRYRILKRLGYNSKTNEIPAGIISVVDEIIERISELTELQAVSLRSGKELVGGYGSLKLNGFLADSDQLILMGITGGKAVTDEIETLKSNGKLTEAVIADAAAGEIVDEGFNRIAEIYSRELIREGRRLSSRRFSAGYGDFDLRFQNDIYRLLDLGRIGVRITEASILLPEKSVTAIYGILGNNNE